MIGNLICGGVPLQAWPVQYLLAPASELALLIAPLDPGDPWKSAYYGVPPGNISPSVGQGPCLPGVLRSSRGCAPRVGMGVAH